MPLDEKQYPNNNRKEWNTKEGWLNREEQRRVGKPTGNRRETDGNPRRNRRETDGNPRGNVGEPDGKRWGNIGETDGKQSVRLMDQKLLFGLG